MGRDTALAVIRGICMQLSSPTRRLALAIATLAMINAAAVATAQAADWPARPIRIVVPYPTGGVTDSIVRVLAERISSALGQPVFVENRAGAGGTLGVDVVAKAQPDGYTIGFAAISPLTLNPHVMKVPYDALKDVTAIGAVMYSPVYLLATPGFKGETLQDAIALCKASRGSVSIATSGYGSVGHVMVAQLHKKSGAQMTHVPYKGGGQIATDAMGGNFDLMLANPYPALNNLIEQGKLRALAVGAPARLSNLPATPTFAELGYPEANLTSLFGFFAPAKTPVDIVSRLNQTINRILESPEIQERVRKAENMVVTSTPAEFQARIEREYAANASIVSEANIRAE